jgi:signal transduction histidine kinase
VKIDLRDALRAAIDDVLPDINSRDLQFTDALPADPAWVMGDRAALYQLFINLLLNAAQATPEGGRVHVAMSRLAEGVVVRVRDSGPGIDAALREEVFAPFHTTKPAGTGLGLAIARRIATAHGGRVVVEDGPPPGAVLLVELPSAPNVTS